ncbi:MAG: helix-turn-helix domain-containing protein [Bacteroidia bacterium]
MHTFTFSETEYQDLLKRLDEINHKLLEKQKVTQEIYDNADLMKLLKVSRRTLSTWRSEQLLEFSQVGSKLYYTKDSVENFLSRYRIKRIGK